MAEHTLPSRNWPYAVEHTLPTWNCPCGTHSADLKLTQEMTEHILPSDIAEHTLLILFRWRSNDWRKNMVKSRQWMLVKCWTLWSVLNWSGFWGEVTRVAQWEIECCHAYHIPRILLLLPICVAHLSSEISKYVHMYHSWNLEMLLFVFL